MLKRASLIFFVLYVVFGIYFLNFGFTFLVIPEFISKFNNWITFLGGVLLVIGGINFLRLKKYASRILPRKF